ncbi:hypothetical protein AVEN_221773-1 [Araneus ventricosus]|uniref:Uncharacterized protein n=1 Tax=Araneus ventricosus TaxID=182803 RepID=A0A4Y2QHL8_ARAVE|nr:hypothetical protein AVEN_41358-1 [Araneus ventricosus]GBN62811.1 hypothetical protein AVEN_64753-1 [Araneus ventricosus]GBN62813.1 hypothetical protein AVEN_78809-1 [Araneus ventricosus]GBN62845.1 hypothetical protein AVEN_221773-1 [Araneus ventricosus]
MAREGMSTSSFQRLILPQLHGTDPKSCLQRDMAHSQLTLRDLASEPPIAVFVASWEAFSSSQPATALQAHVVLPSPETTLNISGGKESSKTHYQEFK